MVIVQIKPDGSRRPVFEVAKEQVSAVLRTLEALGDGCLYASQCYINQAISTGAPSKITTVRM